MKWTFCLQISIKGFFKLILSFWVCVTRPRQITQNNKLFLCNILKKKWVIKLILKFPINWYYDFWWGWSGILKVPKVESLQCLYKISKKKLETKFIFCVQININDFNTLIHFQNFDFPTRWYYDYWWEWSGILKAFKVTSLQYLYNISKVSHKTF